MDQNITKELCFKTYFSVSAHSSFLCAKLKITLQLIDVNRQLKL